MPENVITQIRVKTDGVLAEESAPIGTSTNYVDYQGASLQSILGSGLSPDKTIKQQLTEVQTAIQNNKNTIQQMNQSYNMAKKIINKVNALSQQVNEIQSNTSNEVARQLNQRTLTTQDIRYQTNSGKNLQDVLGALINLPLDSQNLRDCLENIVKKLNNSNNNNDSDSNNDLMWESIGEKPFQIEFVENLPFESFTKIIYYIGDSISYQVRNALLNNI